LWRSERPAKEHKIAAGVLQMVRSIITSERFADLEIVALALGVGIAVIATGALFAAIMPQI
jgi:hypothetical protein